MSGKSQTLAIVALCAVLCPASIGLAVTLSGRVYEGEVGDERNPLSRVTVTLYGSNNSGQKGTYITSTTTNSEGWYGLEVETGFEFYHIVETNPEKYTSVGATTVGGTVIDSDWIQYAYPLDGKTLTGNKFWDKKEGQPPENHPPVANAGPDQAVAVGNVVQLNGSGSSDADGDPLTYSWSLIERPAGSGASLSNPTTVNPTFVADKAGTFVAQLVVNDGKVDSSPDTVAVIVEGQPPSQTGTITGVKFNDENGDGIWNGAETGLAGWTIFADMDPYNAQLDPGEPSDVTGPDGSYSLSGLALGVYNVYEAAQADWQATRPSGGFYGITIQGNDLWDGRDFGNHYEGQPARTGTITGVKFNDLNGNAQKDEGEPGLEGWTIYLDLNDNGVLDEREPRTTTGRGGRYSFTELEPRLYRVDEILQSGWRQTYPQEQGESAFWAVELAPGGVEEDVDFGNAEGGAPMEACCLPDGSCASLTPEQCRERGGAPQGPGTVCMGDANGDGVDDICGGQPGGRDYLFDVCLNAEIDIPGVGLVRTTLTGPARIRIQVGPNGQAFDLNGNGRDEAPAELVSLDLAGMDPLVGAVRLRLSPYKSSTGEVEEQANATPGLLDIEPFTAAGSADSFFDVFVEVELPDLGLVLSGCDRKRLSGVIESLVPGAASYSEQSSGTAISLYREVAGADVCQVLPRPSPSAFLNSLASCDQVPPVQGRYDYGDAPSLYPTTLAQNGARHTSGGPWLGMVPPDTEQDGQHHGSALGDDSQGIDDEDGMGFMSAVVPGQFTWVGITFSGPGQDLTFAMWVDWNQNGQWEDPAERYTSGNMQSLPALPLGIVVANPVPGSAKPGTTFARVRVYKGLNAAISPTGDGGPGEVEDFQVEVKPTGQILPPGHMIIGTKFNDVDGDGSWEPLDGEGRLSNWTIWLDINNDGTPDKTTQTDSQGGFEFAGLSPGTYTIGEQQQAGWTQTTPSGPGAFTVTAPGGLQPTISFAMFGNRRTQDDRELDFGDAPDTYKTLRASGGAYHEAGPLTFGASVDIETDGQPGPDATGDDLGDKDDEDGLVSGLNLTTGKIATISLTVANGDTSTDSGMVAGWIDFDGNGQFDLVSDDLGTQYVTVPGGGQATVQFTFLVPPGSRAGKTYARFRLYRDDPNPLAIPWAILPTGPADYGEVEDYVVTIRSGISPTDRDYGDAPLPYPSADHPLGGPYLGPFGDLPDADPGMQRNAMASGDDNDADGDDENGLLSMNLVKTSGVLSHAEMRMWVGSTGDATAGLWIDWNGDGDWDDPGELKGSAGISYTKVPPGGGWLHVTWGFPVPATAKPGNTFVRLRVYEGFNVALSPSGGGAAGEVEDHLVQIKADGPGLPPGGIVHGYKWDDRDGDGVWDITEPGLPGWTTWLDLNGNGIDDAGDRHETTDAQGHFRFVGVPAGTYAVGEKPQVGWTQTCPPAPGTYTETVTPGSASFPLVFGNTTRRVPPPDTLKKLDWGDAPDPTYPTLRSSNGAYHVIVPGFHLGAGVDGESDGQPSPEALGDDHAGPDDEDGVYFLTPILPAQMAQIEIIAAASGKVDAWIDFHADGAWSQAADHILTGAPINAGSNMLAITVPAGAAVGKAAFARFRFSSAGALPYDGPASDGEVEDYAVWLGDGGPLLPSQRPAHVKWSQPPIEIDPNLDPNSGPPVYCGWDEPAASTHAVSRSRVWLMGADDFRCLGPMPVTRIRWWGSYRGWEKPEPPAVQPVTWRIGVWTDTPVTVPGHVGRPGILIWQAEVLADRVRMAPAGIDRFSNQPADQCFGYDLWLEPNEFFWQPEVQDDQSDVFWLSITAVYPDGIGPEFSWGWKTRPQPWRDSAMTFEVRDESLETGFVMNPSIHPGNWISSLVSCDQQQGYGLAFELLTDPPWIKWDQPFTGLRGWPYYEDIESQGTSIRQKENISRIVADDWVCERNTPLIAAAWWGSYIGYGYEACQCEPHLGPPRPDYFLLTISANVGPSRDTPYSRPGDTVWQYRAYDYDEVLVGYDKDPEGEPNEPVFRYSVRLPQGNWFRQEAPGTAYWFSVAAVYTDPLPMIVHPWGWTNHPHQFGAGASLIDYRLATPAQWRLLHDPGDRPVDMSFTLFTLP